MKRLFNNWQLSFALVLITLSAIFYLIHYAIFRDAHHIFIYLIGDIAFLFLDVLIVLLILHRLLVYREKQSMLKKLNMVIGSFFSEVGTTLLKDSGLFDPGLARLGRKLIVTKDWSDRDFALARKSVQEYESGIDSRSGDLEEMKKLLAGKRQFLLNLLGNPNLLEHESFTNLLWAVFHLTDELTHRADLKNLPDADYQHLSGDIQRSYQQLILQWLDYLKHLKADYPYLFSLAIRTNPFDAAASVEIKA